MIKIYINGEWVEGQPTQDGQKYREYSNGGGFIELQHRILSDNDRSIHGRIWRDEELRDTDWIVPVTDHPKHQAVIDYRQELRLWPETEDFPETKPINPLN